MGLLRYEKATEAEAIAARRGERCQRAADQHGQTACGLAAAVQRDEHVEMMRANHDRLPNTRPVIAAPQ